MSSVTCKYDKKLPIYPGVPDVSFALSDLRVFATPKSVILRYPMSNDRRTQQRDIR